MFVYIYHISSGKNTRQMNRLIELCSFVGQGVVICVWLPPLHVSTKKHVLLSLQCLYNYVGNLSLLFSHSISLPPSNPLFFMSPSVSQYSLLDVHVFVCCVGVCV